MDNSKCKKHKIFLAGFHSERVERSFISRMQGNKDQFPEGSVPINITIFFAENNLLIRLFRSGF